MTLTEENKKMLDKIIGYSDWHADHGVLLICDSNFEWMFDWWLKNYYKHNDFPICLLDAGLSEKFLLDHKDLMIKKMIIPEIFNDKTPIQRLWFSKPFVLRQSPFKKTIYIDLDCEVRDSIRDLFEFSDFAMAKDVENNFDGSKEELFNCGVIVYENESKTIDLWCDAIIEDIKNKNDSRGDQQIFNRNNFPCKKIDPKYNWVRLRGENDSAIIFHHTGEKGHFLLREKICTKQ